jgi:signal transduction histidine kinase
MYSLESRLQLWLGMSLVLLMVLLLFVSDHSIRGLTEDFVIARIEHDAESMLSALEVTPGSARIRWRRINQIYSQPFSGHYFVIRFDEDKFFTSRSLWDYSLDIPMIKAGESRRMHMDGPAGQELYIWIKGYRKRGIDFTLAVAEDHSHTHNQIERYRRNFLVVALLGILGLLAMQRLLVHRSLRSLDELREDVRQLAHGHKVKLSENVPSEILPLVSEANHLLDLLSQRIERSRNSLGNLAHALKSPLTLLVQYFDSQATETTDQQQAKQQVTRIQQLMDRELKRARLAGGSVSSQLFNPQRDLPDMVGLLQQVYVERKLNIVYHVDANTQPFGDREDMLELIGNLLDNACKWATSHVECRVSGSHRICIIVEDDGAGLSDNDMTQLAQRGVRLDESVSGHGLGLSIVQDIVRLYGGTIEFSPSQKLTGLKVVVELPELNTRTFSA